MKPLNYRRQNCQRTALLPATFSIPKYRCPSGQQSETQHRERLLLSATNNSVEPLFDAGHRVSQFAFEGARNRA
jgi:hypothetical protein